MKRLFLLFIFLASLAFNISAQTSEKTFQLKGVVKDKNSGVITGLPLYFKNGDKISSVWTDINGKFSTKLSPGNYEITVGKNFSDKFIAFVNIAENGLNPDNVEFNIDVDSDFCGKSSKEACPKIIKSDLPKYPAAARAVRAMGLVQVKVKIDRQGQVISAQAISGHPLLKRASENSATKFLFESSEIEEREQILLFVFTPFEEKDENIKRYSNPYRIEIMDEPATIEY